MHFLGEIYLLASFLATPIIFLAQQTWTLKEISKDDFEVTWLWTFQTASQFALKNNTKLHKLLKDYGDIMDLMLEHNSTKNDSILYEAYEKTNTNMFFQLHISEFFVAMHSEVYEKMEDYRRKLGMTNDTEKQKVISHIAEANEIFKIMAMLAASRIVESQCIYMFRASEVLAGTIRGRSLEIPPFTWRECSRIATEALMSGWQIMDPRFNLTVPDGGGKGQNLTLVYSNAHFSASVEWALHATKLGAPTAFPVVHVLPDGKGREERLETLLDVTCKTHDRSWEKAEPNPPSFYILKTAFWFPERIGPNLTLEQLEDFLSSHDLHSNSNRMVEENNFAKACQRSLDPSDFGSNFDEQPLSCFLDHRRPYFVLNPLKAEMLNRRPELMIYHQVLSPTACEALLDKLNISRWKWSSTSGTDVNERYVSKRHSKVLYMKGWKEWRAEQIRKTLDLVAEATTDLDMDGSEQWQIVSYSSGHFYGSHWDTSSHVLEPFDDDIHSTDSAPSTRAATVLVYLSDVEVGGATGYGDINTFVRPEIGSVVVQRNHDQDGNPSNSMKHGGCPVLLGLKIVAVKWLDGFGQFLRVPCSLVADPDFSTTYKGGRQG